jgi:hypothetical protein
MIKYYALEVDSCVHIRGCRQCESVPAGAVEITREAAEAAKAIRHPIDRKISGSEVVEKSESEKDIARTAKYGEQEKAIAHYKIGRRSYRLTRLPFDFEGKKIKLEEGDMRRTPYGIFSTWDNFIRDALLAELYGASVLPFDVLTDTNETVTIRDRKQLEGLHAAMVQSNKAILAQEVALRLQLTAEKTYNQVQDIRALNRERTKE